MANHGIYSPRYPQKYAGDHLNIQFRSSWEAAFMQFVDLNPNVVSWGSEEISIPYIKPTDGRVHRYIPDFWMEVRTQNRRNKKISDRNKTIERNGFNKKDYDSRQSVHSDQLRKMGSGKIFL